MATFKNYLLKFRAVALVILSIYFRVISFPYSNHDMTTYNLQWYETLYQKGITNALATAFSNYTPPYTYLLALATYTHDLIPPLIAIKLIPTGFDLLSAFYIYKIVKLKYPQGDMAHLASATYFIAPTVILNSAYWGQADSLYTSLLLVCIYFLIVEKPFISILAFGLALSIKVQAIFFLPFLGVMIFRKKMPWVYFGVVPLIYLLAILPVVVLGRPFLETLLIYIKQSDSYPALSMNSPNIYVLFTNDWHDFIVPIGITATVLLIMRWIYTTSQSKINLSKKYLILIAVISTTLTPFLLPKMHDRYFYPADVLSILLAFYWPSLWFIPILFQLASLISISAFLFQSSASFIIFGFLLNTIAFAIILRTQRTMENQSATKQNTANILSWLTAVFVSVIFFILNLNILLTPAFIKLNYSALNNSSGQYSLSKSERYQWASQSVKYLTNDKKNQYLLNLKFDNGAPVFNDYEIIILDNTKKLVQRAITLRNVSLALCFILGSLAWACEWLPSLWQGIRRGGWLTIGLALIFGIAGLVSGFNSNNYFQNTEIIPQLFPLIFWKNILILIFLMLCGSGFLLTRLTIKH